MSEESNIDNLNNESVNNEIDESNVDQDTTTNDNLAFDENSDEDSENEFDHQEDLTEEEIEELEQATNEGRKLNGVQKKINKFYQEKKQAQEENALLKAKIEELEASRIEPEKPLIRPIKPDELDFDDTNDYIRANAKYEDELIEFGKKSAEVEVKQSQKIQPKIDNYNETLKKVNEINPKFQQNLEALDRVGAVDSYEFRQALVDSEHGAFLLNEIAKDPIKGAEITKLAKNDLSRFYREIGKIEAKLSLVSSKIDTGLKKQQPKPITPITGTAGIVKNIEAMTPEEYASYMRKKGSKVF